MSKFCTKCGATLDDNATFCTACGAKSEVTAAASAPAGNSGASAAAGETPLDQLKQKSMQAISGFNNNPKKNTYIGIAVVAVAAIILIVLIANALGGGYKGALNSYFSGICNKDGKEYLSATSPGVVQKYLKKEEDIDKNDQIKAAKSSAKSKYDRLEDYFGKDLKISYKITEKEKYDKDDLEDIEDFMNSFYDDEIKFKLGGAYDLELELTIKGKDDKEDEIDATATVVKINGDWVITDFDCDDFGALNY